MSSIPKIPDSPTTRHAVRYDIHLEDLRDVQDFDDDPVAFTDEHDPVSNPRHYTQGDVECIDAIRSALGDDGFRAYCRGQVIKYTWRMGMKGDAEEDAGKAAWYLEMLNREAK